MNPANPLADIGPGELEHEYHRRGLDRLTDFDLLATVVDVVRIPRDRMTSFTLHAPLEVLARYSLLPHVLPGYRELARLQLVAVAALIQTIPAAHAIARGPDPSSEDEAWRGLLRAIDAGNVAEAESLADWLADNTRWQSAAEKLGNAVLDSLAAAAHAPIYLYLTQRLGLDAPRSALPFLRPYCRALSQGHDLRLAVAADDPPVDSVRASAGKSVAQRIARVLGSANRGIATSGGIAPMVLATERAHAEDVGAWFPTGSFEHWDAAHASIARVAAASMLQDDRGQAKYGWTHCLTIPHGLWAINDRVADKHRALWLASAVAYGFRATAGRSVVTTDYRPERTTLAFDDALLAGPELAAGAAFHVSAGDVDEVRTALATQASIRNDAHLVKYTLSCLDVARMDPAYARLYHAAAAHLLSIWMETTPNETLKERIANDRT